jgi:hypothetical protein
MFPFPRLEDPKLVARVSLFAVAEYSRHPSVVRHLSWI